MNSKDFCANELAKLATRKYGFAAKIKITSNEGNTKQIELNEETAAILGKFLQDHYNYQPEIKNPNTAGWSIEDIIEHAQADDLEISKEQAEEVLNYMEQQFDATIGINWDVIAEAIHSVLNETNNLPQGQPDKDGWILTDESCQQYCKEIQAGKIYRFKENRLINPKTGETEHFELELDYEDYSREELLAACATFGYTTEQVDQWIESGEEIPLMLECIFELEN